MLVCGGNVRVNWRLTAMIYYNDKEHILSIIIVDNFTILLHSVRKMSCITKTLLLILAIFLPFVSVAIVKGCHSQLLVSILLTILAWPPGVIYAWYIILKHDN